MAITLTAGGGAMRRHPISISALMGGILFVAVGFAALKYPTPLAAHALVTLLQGSLVVAILGVVLRRGPRRAFWVGFAICGGAYALLAFDLSPSPALPRPQLVTVELLVILKAYLISKLTTADIWQATINTASFELFAQIGQSLTAMVVAVSGGFLGRFFADHDPQR